jgi:hypothetical protein
LILFIYLAISHLLGFAESRLVVDKLNYETTKLFKSFKNKETPD